MPRKHTLFVLFGTLAFALLPAHDATAAPLDPAFTYQGRLKNSGQAATGSFNMTFTLWDAADAGNQIGAADSEPNAQVTDGLFTVVLNDANQFGAAAFNGEARWLQVVVDGTPVLPRQPVTATPYAQGLLLPFIATVELASPPLSITHTGLAPAARFELAASATLPLPSPQLPALEGINSAGGVAASFKLEPPADPWMVDPFVPALAVGNLAGGLAGSFYIPNPDDPDGCVGPCPPWPWPFLDAPVLDVSNLADGPAARFATDAAQLLPAVHVANSGLGQAVQARSVGALGTIEAANCGGGSAATLFIPGPAARIDDCGSEVPAWPWPDPWPWNAPVLDVINDADGPVARFASDAVGLVPAVHVANAGDGSALVAVAQAALPALEAANTGPGPAIKALSTGGPCFEGQGDFMLDGNVHVTGELMKEYNGGGSPNRAAPIAYASIRADGTLASGTPNVTSVLVPGPQPRYHITIAGESYTFSDYVTLVTVEAGTSVIATTAGDLSGDMVVTIQTLGGTPTQRAFHLLTYKP